MAGAKEDIKERAKARTAKAEAKDPKACLKARVLAKVSKEVHLHTRALQFFSYRHRPMAHPLPHPQVQPTLLAISVIRKAITSHSAPNGWLFDHPQLISKHDIKRHALA